MNVKHKVIVAAFSAMLCGTAQAQMVPLVDNKVYLDADKVWNYNLYERSRWGLGLKYTPVDSVALTGYVAYGTRDQQVKGGVGASWTLPWSHRGGTLYLGLARDYYAAASRRLKSTSITDIGGLSTFMQVRMNDRRMLTAGYVFTTKRSSYTIDVRLFRGYRLYQGATALYLVDGAVLPRHDGLEACLAMHRRSGLSAELLFARTGDGHYDNDWRLLLQYDNTFTLGPLSLSTFAQAGTVFDKETDITYRFDLGGTYGSPLWFRDVLLTARPNEYLADQFLFGSLRLTTRKALFTWWNKTVAVGINPSPTLGVNAAYGRHLGDAASNVEWEPDITVVELVAGVDGLLRWGVADYGVAWAWRLPLNAAAERRRVLLFTARLSI